MSACLLDLTRLVSRLGQGPLTGIDRVEAAWADCLIARKDPVLALVRTGLGYLVLDRSGISRILDHAVQSLPLPEPDWIARLRRQGRTNIARAESLARKLASHRVPRPFLRMMLRRLFPEGGVYFNLGHANLNMPVLDAIGRANLTRVVMIHDTIPLEYPQFTRPAIVTSFESKLRSVATGADAVIHLAQATRVSTELQLKRFGRVPRGIVAPLAVPMPVPSFDGLSHLCPEGPYFVALGTIEPRKNTRFLLDLWDRMPTLRPSLILLGRKGWEEDAVLSRAEATQGVQILSDLPDARAAAILSNAKALLFPSLAEGFGLPPVEAARLGVPVVANPLPVLHETLGDYPIYLDPNDIYSWMETINSLTEGEAKPTKRAIRTQGKGFATDWDDHVNCVFAGLRQVGPMGHENGQEE